VACFPACSAWCVCEGTECVPTAVTVNALRLRTADGRYLGSGNVGQGLVVAKSVGSPGFAETFILVSPATGPLNSPRAIQLAIATSGWTRAASQIRVDHNVITLPPRDKKSPRLVTYEVGGPGARVLDSPPFSAGYPAYPGDDPAERIFTIVKLVGSAAASAGTPINNGDRVVLRIDSNRGNTFFFRVIGGGNGAEVHGDGTVLGQAGTVFFVELNEVRAGLGWRPTTVVCRACAAVTAVVRRAGAVPAMGVPGASATLQVQGHTYQGVSGTTGRAPLSESDGNTCVPAGTVTVQASANRYQNGSATDTVPSSGTKDIVVQLQCTQVRGRVVDQAGSGRPGVTVYLRDQNGMVLLDENGNPLRATTDANGNFVFNCVQHGFVQVWTTAAPTQMQHTKVIGPDGWVNVTIVVQTTCGDLVGRVVDADTGQPIAGATVTESGGRQTTTDANGNFTFTCVMPGGSVTVFASAPGYPEEFEVGFVPSSGQSTPVVIELRRASVAEIQVRLDWGTQPSDLDSHLSGPDGAGGTFHCFFVNRTPVAHAELDADDTTALGPETITIRRSPAGTGSFVAGDYHYWVHNYSGSTFAGSNALIAVSSADAQGMLTSIATYSVVNATGAPADDLWHVVNLTIDANGNVTRADVQTLQAGDSSTVL
jgi:uncharacterized protein YfaP (DUF2135 family)